MSKGYSIMHRTRKHFIDLCGHFGFHLQKIYAANFQIKMILKYCICNVIKLVQKGLFFTKLQRPIFCFTFKVTSLSVHLVMLLF